MTVESPAFANQSGSYSAEQTRRAIFAAYARTSANNPGILVGGILSATDLQVTAPASGMSVNVSTGEAIIGGTEGGAQGAYYGRVTSQTNLSIAAANPSNPRIDLVCATISDSGYTEPTGGSGNQFALQVVTGTPTSGATLANLLGAPTLPGSSLLLAYVLVPAGASNIITADLLAAAQSVTMNGPLAVASTSAPTPGQMTIAAPSTTVTIPAPAAAGQQIGVTAASTVTPTTPVTVEPASGVTLYGLGFGGGAGFITSSGSLTLGTPSAGVTFISISTTQWVLIAGEQDTGWVDFVMGSNVEQATSAFYTASARLQGDIVRLKGGIAAISGSITAGTTLATIASGLRPSQPLGFAAIYATSIDEILVSTAGVITTATATISSGSALVFDGITYSLN